MANIALPAYQGAWLSSSLSGRNLFDSTRSLCFVAQRDCHPLYSRDFFWSGKWLGVEFPHAKNKNIKTKPTGIYSPPPPFNVGRQRKKKAKKRVGVSRLPSKCKSTPVGVCLHGEGRGPRFASELPRWQTDRQAGYFSSKLFSDSEELSPSNRLPTHTDRGHVEQWRGPVGFFFFFCCCELTRQTLESHREGQRDRQRDIGTEEGQTETVRLALSRTNLMRGTLSRVQHKVGPLCKCSSSSHDWLYNLQRQTCMNTCAHAGYSGVAQMWAMRSETGQTQTRATFWLCLRFAGRSGRRGKILPANIMWHLVEKVKEGVRSVSEVELCSFFVCFLFFDKCITNVARLEFRAERKEENSFESHSHLNEYKVFI